MDHQENTQETRRPSRSNPGELVEPFENPEKALRGGTDTRATQVTKAATGPANSETVSMSPL